MNIKYSILLSIMSFFPLYLFANEELIVEEFEYSIEREEIIITGYKGKEKTVIIPDQIESYTVTTIGVLAFNRESGSSLESVILPNTLTTIKVGAFLYCTELSSLHIPENVSLIEEGFLLGCSSIKEFTVDRDNPYFTASDGILYNKDKTLLLAYPAARESTTFSVSSPVIKVFQGAFTGSRHLQSIVIADNVDISNGEVLFADSKSLNHVVLPKNLEEIAPGMFLDCPALTAVDIPTGVKKIGVSAFQNSGLVSLELPDTLESIGEDAFDGCQSLTDIYINASKAPETSGWFFISGCTIHVREGAIGYDSGVWEDMTIIYVLPRLDEGDIMD